MNRRAMPNTSTSTLLPRVSRCTVTAVICLAASGCATSGASELPSPTSAAAGTPSPGAVSEPPTTGPSAAESASPSGPAESQAPDTGGGTTYGDVPDNAVFLTYHQATLGFSIQYVEGWQVRTQQDGVAINDKDSSETVAVVPPVADIPSYVSSTDLPSLQGQAGFKLIKQNTVKVRGASYQHLVYHILSPADPVTGKQIPSTADRYYVPGPAHLAIVTLSTPDGVDNVDAFRQMIESFRWA